MFNLSPDAAAEVEEPYGSRDLRDVNSDVIQVAVYRQGFHAGADGRAPERSAWAYERGYRSGIIFRERISATRPYIGEPHFPGYPSLHNVYITVASGGMKRIKFPKRVLQVLSGAKRY